MLRDNYGSTPPGSGSSGGYAGSSSAGGAGIPGSFGPGSVGGPGVGSQPSDTPSGEYGEQGASQVRSKAREVANRVAGQAREQVGKVRDQAQSRLEEGKGQMAGSIDQVARAFHRASDQLRDENQTSLARYTEELASGVDRVAGYLRDRDTQALLEDVRGIAQRQPAMFLAGAFALGLIAGRFFKSTDQRPMERDEGLGGEEPYTSSSSYYGPPGYGPTGPSGSEGTYAPV